MLRWLRRAVLAVLVSMVPVVVRVPAAAADGHGQWFPTSTTPIYPGNPLVDVPDGRLLASSSRGPGADLVHLSVYDPLTGAWSQAAPGGMTQGNDAPVLLADGRVLLSWGHALQRHQPRQLHH